MLDKEPKQIFNSHLNGHLAVLQLYTFLSTTLFILFLPLIFLISLFKTKYRGRTLQRLGITLKQQLPQKKTVTAPVIWIHALSVGEVTSALPLIRGLRSRYPKGTLFLSTTTRSGRTIAREIASDWVDTIFFSPFEMYFSVQRYITLLNPSIFILVETDFWPGWLFGLQRREVPCLLVNGRFSKKSLQTYNRFRFLFQPMFDCFFLLSMQTKEDGKALVQLGIRQDKITTLGNLKFASSSGHGELSMQRISSKADLGFSASSLLLICGSTHKGEEMLLYSSYKTLKKTFPDLCLLIAPRDIHRAQEVESLLDKHLFTIGYRTRRPEEPIDILLLDTLGELATCYRFADVAFIGGSLVAVGGHNPIEAAKYGVPVLFGPYMDDFTEISRDLIKAGGAILVHSADEFSKQTGSLLNDHHQRLQMGQCAQNFILSNTGIMQNYLKRIQQILQAASVSVSVSVDD